MTCVVSTSRTDMSDLFQLSYAADTHRGYSPTVDDRTPRTTGRGHPPIIRLPSMSTSMPASHALPTPAPSQNPCYWGVLTEDLTFLYLDPELTHHIGQLADSLLGRSIFDLAHPQDRLTARENVRHLQTEQSFNGSVFCTRLASVETIRRAVHHSHSYSSWQPTQGTDDEYIETDVVLTWVADGIVLCHMHASHPAHEDERSRNAWFWCSTFSFSPDDARALYERLHNASPSSSRAHGHKAERVFQILQNTADRQPLLTWPPDGSFGRTTHGFTSMDYTRVAQEIPLTDHPNSTPKTNCTRRSHDERLITTAWGSANLDSLLTVHGSIIFVSHRLVASNPTRIQTQFADYAASEHQVSPSTTSPYTYGDQHISPHSQVSQYTPQWNYHYQPAQEIHIPPLRHYASAELYPTYNADTTQNYRPPTPNSGPPTKRRISPMQSSSDPYDGRVRPGNPPVGLTQCASCGTTTSPEWRRGESGKKDLCNACGLRYSRRKAKEKGTPAQRRKKMSVNLDDPMLQGHYHLAGDLHAQALRRGSVDSLGTTHSSSRDTPTTTSSPSPTSAAHDMGHYSYMPPQHQYAERAPAPQHPGVHPGAHHMVVPPQYIYGPGGAFAASSHERIQHDHRA